jgi:hypothetical protein
MYKNLTLFEFMLCKLFFFPLLFSYLYLIEATSNVYLHLTYSHTYISSSSSSSIGTTTLSWVSACSTVVEHAQQEGFTECRCKRHVKTPNWRKTRDLERSNFRHKRPPASEATLAKYIYISNTLMSN